MTYRRGIVDEIKAKLKQNIRLLHVITGPRQVGKTTAAQQIAEDWDGEVVYSAADTPLPPTPEWIESNWERANIGAKNSRVLLILDEVQKISGWSEVVKARWDKEKTAKSKLSVIILGSSSLLLQKGLSESLAGRFFEYRCMHWSYSEMKKAFDFSLDDWLFLGGYPGAAIFRSNFGDWSRYVTDSLIETVLARDIFQLQNITKPALMRHLFMLAAAHPAQILSYNKMLGQLQDVGNTTTLAHYLKLLQTAFLASGLEAYKSATKAKKGSSPKLVIWNNAIINSLKGIPFDQARRDYGWWGRLVENAVISHFLNHLGHPSYGISYWRDGQEEVDVAISTPTSLWGIEVKSGRPKSLRGLSSFKQRYPKAKTMIIGEGGMPFEDFFAVSPLELF